MPGKLDKSIQDMWVAVKSATENVFERDITPEEVNYLLSRYPLLEICDIDRPFYLTREPTIHQARSGWKVFDFDSVLVASACELLCRPEDPLFEGKGTIYAQYTDTAIEMVGMAKKKNWQGAEIVAGLYAMRRAFWARALAEKLRVRGFSATPEDTVVFNWLNAMWEGTFYTPKGVTPDKTN